MRFTTYCGLIFSAMRRYVQTTKNGRVLFFALVPLFGFIALTAIIPDGPNRTVAAELNFTEATDAFVARAGAALPDMDPITIDTLRAAVENLTGSSDRVKRQAFRAFADQDRAGAIATLAAHAQAQADAGETGEALRSWKQTGALAFLVDPAASIRAYEAALVLAPTDPSVRSQLGLLYSQAGRDLEAITQFLSVLDTENLTGTAWEASAFGNLGILAIRRGDMDKAEYYVLQSLQLNEKLERRKAAGLQHANLAVIAGTFDKEIAVERNLKRALTIFEDLGEQENAAQVLGNLGVFERNRDNQDTAEQYLTKSYELYRALGDKQGMATQLDALARTERRFGNRDQAEAYYKQSLTLNQALGHRQAVAVQFASLGGIELERERIDGACTYWREAWNIFDDVGPAASRDQVQSWLDVTGCQEAE